MINFKSGAITTMTVSSKHPIDVKLEDSGNAYVSLWVRIGDYPPINFNENHVGSLTSQISLTAGSYDCAFHIFAHTDPSVLGQNYNSSLTLSGTLVATSRSAIPSGNLSDHGSHAFNLNIT